MIRLHVRDHEQHRSESQKCDQKWPHYLFHILSHLQK